jgi:hypothetical protein
MQKIIKMNIMKNKHWLAILSFALILFSCTAGPNGGYVYQQPVYVAPGVGLGTIIAVVISWSRNKSVLWAIIHGILGWLYVIYALLFSKK